jgi:ABC-type transporter Mla subunit MlaD
MAETLQLIITADSKEALKAVEDLAKSTEGLKTKFTTLGSASGQANQALVNSGRVLQDLNYGFMGVANNLNPLLESFQRLGERAKDTGSTVKKELVSALTGPAGIGVALSAVTFIFLKFGDEISDFFTKIITGNQVLKSQKESLAGVGEEFKSAVEKVDKVSIAFQEYHSRIITGNEALKIYNTELGKNFGVKKDINEAEKTFKDKSAAYVEASFQRALADSASKKAAEELLKIRLLQAQGPKVSIQDFLSVLTPAGIIDPNKTATTNAVGRYKKDMSDLEILTAQFRKIALDANSAADLFAKGFNLNLTTDKTGAVKKDPLAEATKDYQESNQRNLTLFNESLINQQEYFIESEKIWQEYVNKLKNINTTPAVKILKSLTPKEIIKDELYNADLEQKAREQLKGVDGSYFGKPQLAFGSELVNKSKLNTTDNELSKFLKNVKEQYKEAHDAADSFARDMAGNITSSLQSAYHEIQKGENVFKALSDSVLQFAEDLAFAIIRAQIFAAIQGAITIGTGGAAGAAAGGTGFFDIIMGLLGGGKKLATGGVTNGPSLSLIGEAGPEAVLPLSKLSGMLNTTFNAGAMSGGVGVGGNGSFVLRGNDLVLALQRSNSSLNLRRGGI